MKHFGWNLRQGEPETRNSKRGTLHPRSPLSALRSPSLALSSLLLALLCFAPGCCCSKTASSLEPRALFNGQDLSGWVVMHEGEWTVEDGVLIGRNGKNWSTNPEVSGSWLRTDREYADFILELEYAIQGNSGILLRSGLEKNPSFTGYEMQVVADHGREPSRGSAGSLYDVVAATQNMSKPAGEWNQVRIRAEGPRIRIAWNGVETMDFTNATRSTQGYLGLQNHDERSVVKFRNIRITEL